MNLLHFPDAVSSKNVRVWNNATFDDAAGGSVAAATLPWPLLQPISINQSESLDPDPGKENSSPIFDKSPDSEESSTAHRPLGGLIAVSGRALKVSFKENAQIDEERIDDEMEEIERQIKRLSSRLEELRIKKAELRAAVAGRRGRIVPAKFMDPKKILQAPASKKIEQSPASAKFRRRGGSLGPLEIIAGSPNVVDLKQSLTEKLWSSSALKKIDESPASARFHRRGVSLGPLEFHESIRDGTSLKLEPSHKKQGFRKLEGIQEEKGERSSSSKSRPTIAAKASVAGKGATPAIVTKKVAESPANARLQRRGVSLGPSEIAASARSRQSQEVKEKGMDAEKGGRSLSTSPKSRLPSVAAKVSNLRKGIRTVGAKKPVKKEEGPSTSLKPKALFLEEKNTIPEKRPAKNSRARVVASRYSLATARVTGEEPRSKRRKWSLVELGSEEANGFGSLRGLRESALETEGSQEMELDAQMKAEWEMSSKVDGNVDHSLSVDGKSLPSIMKIGEFLPKIKTLRCIAESPRDSGRAKRVAELVGKRPVFGKADDEDVASPCQSLTFEED